MRVTLIILTVIALISAVFHISAEYLGPVSQIYIFKPLTMLSIIAIAILNCMAFPGFYGKVLIGGLLCSFAGDLFLMFPGNYFIAGLLSFLVGHLFYIVAFAHGRAFIHSIVSPLLFIVYGIFILWLLAPFLGRLLWPVVAYIVVILIMGWQAWERWTYLRKSGAALALIGAILFIVSDSVLAYNKFRAHLEFGRALNLSTYFVAQWFIAWSIRSQAKDRDIS